MGFEETLVAHCPKLVEALGMGDVSDIENLDSDRRPGELGEPTVTRLITQDKKAGYVIVGFRHASSDASEKLAEYEAKLRNQGRIIARMYISADRKQAGIAWRAA
jgi:hypothetical protein